MGKNFVLATLAGAAVLFVVGSLLYMFPLRNLYPVGGPPNYLALVLGQVAAAALVAHALEWKGAAGPADGLRTGAHVGLLVSLAVGLTLLGTANQGYSGQMLAVDAGSSVVLFGLAGLVMAKIMGRA